VAGDAQRHAVANIDWRTAVFNFDYVVSDQPHVPRLALLAGKAVTPLHSRSPTLMFARLIVRAALKSKTPEAECFGRISEIPISELLTAIDRFVNRFRHCFQCVIARDAAGCCAPVRASDVVTA